MQDDEAAAQVRQDEPLRQEFVTLLLTQGKAVDVAMLWAEMLVDFVRRGSVPERFRGTTGTA